VWEVEYTDEFEAWWRELTQAQQEALDDRVMLLAEVGPALRRPVVVPAADDLYDAHLEELRLEELADG